MDLETPCSHHYSIYFIYFVYFVYFVYFDFFRKINDLWEYLTRW